jgi:hypothetical protein
MNLLSPSNVFKYNLYGEGREVKDEDLKNFGKQM